MSGRTVNPPMTIARPHLFNEYVAQHARHLSLTKGIEYDTAAAFVKKIAQDKFQDRNLVSVDHPSSGNTEQGKHTLWTFTQKHKNNVVCPSGSMYVPEVKHKSFVCSMVADKISGRGVLKKLKNKAIEEGNIADEKKYHYGQASLKIDVNSLPGGFGSPWNIFYDKGSYNAITSSARALIAQSYVTAEWCIGGNIPLFTEEEAINWVGICMNHCPNRKVLNDVMRKYKMREMTPEEVHVWIRDNVRQYQHGVECSSVLSMLKGIDNITLQYIYYVGNLRNIMWGNPDTFRPWIQSFLDHSSVVPDPNVDPKDMYKIDGDLSGVVSTILTKEMKVVKKKTRPSDYPELGRLFYATGKRMETMLDDASDLFDAFVFSGINIPHILTRKNMLRNTVVVSDTDSVIFTSAAWADWYVGHLDHLTQDSYNVSALMTYFLTKINEHTMEKFSITLGATGKGIYYMKMKNEFLYPTFLLFDIKKTYAAIIKVIEGVVLEDPRPDLKGSAIRGSTTSSTATKEAANLIVEGILKPGMHGRVSAVGLIRRCVDYENVIRDSVMSGETTYLGRKSVKTKDEYANPDSSAYLYLLAWNAIFGAQYDMILPPDKLPAVKLVKPTEGYWIWLKENHPKTHDKFKSFIERYKMPAAMVMSNIATKIPEELIPIVDTRDIIFSNMKPMYLTLERMNVGVGHMKKQLLLGEVYT